MIKTKIPVTRKIFEHTDSGKILEYKEYLWSNGTTMIWSKFQRSGYPEKVFYIFDEKDVNKTNKK